MDGGWIGEGEGRDECDQNVLYTCKNFSENTLIEAHSSLSNIS